MLVLSYAVDFNLIGTYLSILGYALVQIPELMYAIMDSIENRIQRKKQLQRAVEK